MTEWHLKSEANISEPNKDFDYPANDIIPPDVFYGLSMEMYQAGYRIDFSQIKVNPLKDGWSAPLLKDGQAAKQDFVVCANK